MKTHEPSLRDEAGLRAAYESHGGELYGFAIRALGDRGLAEEATQETFLRAWRGADRFDPSVSSLRTWLFAILRHVVTDLLRRRSARPPLAGQARESEQEGSGAEDFLERTLVSWQVEEALRGLREDHRRVLIETYYRDRPYAEVAKEMGVAEGTVKSRVYYAMKALRAKLEEMGWNDER